MQYYNERQQQQQRQEAADQWAEPHLTEGVQAKAVRLLQLRAAAASRAEQVQQEQKDAEAALKQQQPISSGEVPITAEHAGLWAKAAASTREAQLQKQRRVQELEVAQRRLDLSNYALEAYGCESTALRGQQVLQG
jgi:hypothetical protein